MAATPPESAATAEKSQWNILLVEPDTDLGARLRVFIANLGHMATMTTPCEAASLLAVHSYDLIIADFGPEAETARRLADTVDGLEDTELIVTSDRASTASVIEAIHHQALDYLAKPIDFELLRASLERAFERIEADRFRADMVSMITHDIKIPLSAIIGYSSMIFDKTTGELSPRAREFTQIIQSNGVKILTLIDNFLTSCKIESGRLALVPRPVNLNNIMEDLASLFEVEAVRSGLELSVRLDPGLPILQGDETLLYRASANAVSNACKFTPAGGTVTIRTGRATDAGGRPQARLEVTNTGPGIAPSDLKRLFQRYVRGSAAVQPDGTGLGLYVLKRIVEAHGGTVSLVSEPNRLTTLTVVLPVSEDCDAKSAPQ